MGMMKMASRRVIANGDYSAASAIICIANGGDRLRQGFLATDGCMPGPLYAAR